MDTAEPFARRSVEIRQAALGPDDLAVATDQAAHAAILDALGRDLTAALEIFREHLGDEHYEIAVTLNNLAAIHQRQGHHDAAASLYRRALAIKEALLGPDHPDVAVTLNNLATTRRTQGAATEAAALLQRALTIFERTLRPEHPTLAAVRHNLKDAAAAGRAEALHNHAVYDDRRLPRAAAEVATRAGPGGVQEA